MKRKLRFGMVGGGRGAFIGAVHRLAAQMDGQAELVAGALASEPERARASGEDLFLDPARIYRTYQEMAAAEATRPVGERMDFVAIVTPNDLHFPVAQAFLHAGFHVVCDKPATWNLAQAKSLKKIIGRAGRIFALTHNYTGNVMVKQARLLVQNGALGAVRKVVVEYPQGWLSTPLEKTGQKQAVWRADPKRNGAGGCLGDIGTHALNLALYITGLRVRELCADLTTFVPGRKLDDDASILLRFTSGAKGILHSSQVSVGDENNLNIRVYGERAALEWHQEDPNDLVLKFPDKPRQTWRRGNAYIDPSLARFTRVPPGHPEGYLEAFGNIYQEVFRAIRANEGSKMNPKYFDFPTIADGLIGMAFIETAVRSSAAGASWRRFPRLG